MDLKHVKVRVQHGQHCPCQNHAGVGAAQSPGDLAGGGVSDSTGCSSREAGLGRPSRATRRRRRAPGILMTSSAPNFLPLRSLEVP